MYDCNRTASASPRMLPLAACLGSLFALSPPALAGAPRATPSMDPLLAAATMHAARSDPRALSLRHRPASSATPAAAPALAAMTAVMNCGDDPNDFTTLRHAALTANPGDTIDLSGINCSKLTLNAAIEVDVDDLTIQGPGARALTIDGNGVDRVFLHDGKGTLSLNGMTIAGGKRAADKAYGGCIYSTGSVALTDSVVTSCEAAGQSLAIGGAIFVYDKLTLDSSTISDSLVDSTVGAVKTFTAAGGGAFAHDVTLTHSIVSGNIAQVPLGGAEGGGVIGYAITVKYSTISGNDAISIGDVDNYSIAGGIDSIGTLFVIGSTIDHNQADLGGGAFIVDSGSGFVTIVQSTVSANKGNLSTGGIAAAAALSIGNSTIAFNTGGIGFGGGGLAAVGATATLQSTILADNSPDDLEGGAALSGSNNLIKIPGPGVVPPAGTIPLDPLLGPLAYNGGSTRTHALAAGSPAIDAGGNPANLADDQRGGPFLRTLGFATDIGAVEFDPDHIFANGFGE